MTDDAQSLAEQCGTSVHATEALPSLCNVQEQKTKHVLRTMIKTQSVFYIDITAVEKAA